jgi:hypothetical protein
MIGRLGFGISGRLHRNTDVAVEANYLTLVFSIKSGALMPTTNDNKSSALKEFRLEKFGRFGFSADGKRIRYTALDPADEATECKCGKPGCFAANLFPFREHIARLYRAIAACEQHDRFAHDGWDRVLYPLQMAAAIDDVHAD